MDNFFDKLAIKVGEQNISGGQVAGGIAIAVTSIALLKLYFRGGRCKI